MNGRSQVIRGLILRRAPETHIFSRACRGDAVAFAEVYRRYKGPLYAFCLARLLSRDAAEDATQETFTRVLSIAEPVRNPQAWLFSVARNVCIDVGRRCMRESVVEIPPEEALGGGPGQDAADEAMAAWRARLVLLALRRLRPRYRTALILKEVHGLPAGDIADSLGISEGATYTLLTRARRAFARAYTEVSGLSEGCAEAVMLMFKSSTSTLQKAERDRLQAHVSTCERCRAEDQRLTSSTFSGLLPLLVAQSGAASGLLAQALLTPRPPLAQAAPSVQTAMQVGVPVVVACALLATEITGIVSPPRTVGGLPPLVSAAHAGVAPSLSGRPVLLERVETASVPSRITIRSARSSATGALSARVAGGPVTPPSLAPPATAPSRALAFRGTKDSGPRPNASRGQDASGASVRAAPAGTTRAAAREGDRSKTRAKTKSHAGVPRAKRQVLRHLRHKD